MQLSDVIGIGSLALASISLIFGAYSLVIQRGFNRKSVKPIADIDLGDYVSQIKIQVLNNGIGPMIPTKIDTEAADQKKEYPIEWCEHLNITWSDFSKAIVGRAILPSEGVVLLQYDVSKKSGNTKKQSVR